MVNSRRDFIKISSLSTAGLVVGGKFVHSAIQSSGLLSDNTSEPAFRTPTYCEVCFWKCAGWVYKDEEGKIKKVVGNDDATNCTGRTTDKSMVGVWVSGTATGCRGTNTGTTGTGSQTAIACDIAVACTRTNNDGIITANSKQLGTP